MSNIAISQDRTEYQDLIHSISHAFAESIQGQRRIFIRSFILTARKTLPFRAGHARLACEVNGDVGRQQQEPSEAAA
jgi:hypothetical protein